MKLGGWSDPGTVRKIYTHVADIDLRRQAENLAAFFQP
jgi:integrase